MDAERFLVTTISTLASSPDFLTTIKNLARLATPGLAARFYFRDTATGNIDLSVPAAADLGYATGGDDPLPNPGNTVSCFRDPGTPTS